jgi:hypothetical protein
MGDMYHCRRIPRARGVGGGRQTGRAVPVGYSDSTVRMVKPAQDWQCKHAPYALDVARNRRVLLQRKVRAAVVTILLISVEQMTETRLAKDHHVIEAVPLERFRMPIAVRRRMKASP